MDAVFQEAAAKVLTSNWIVLEILNLHGQVRMVWPEVEEGLLRRARQWHYFLHLYAIDEVLELILIGRIPVTMLLPSLKGYLAGFVQASWYETRALLWKRSDKGAELWLGAPQPMAARQPARCGHELALEGEPSVVFHNLNMCIGAGSDRPGQPA